MIAGVSDARSIGADYKTISGVRLLQPWIARERIFRVRGIEREGLVRVKLAARIRNPFFEERRSPLADGITVRVDRG
jgi:hypothetical protein